MNEFEEPLLHWCEVCDVEAYLTPSKAYDLGWDFPPRMGWFGVVSPRTCPTCPMTSTAWWAHVKAQVQEADLDARHRETVARIARERRRDPD